MKFLCFGRWTSTGLTVSWKMTFGTRKHFGAPNESAVVCVCVCGMGGWYDGRCYCPAVERNELEVWVLPPTVKLPRWPTASQCSLPYFLLFFLRQNLLFVLSWIVLSQAEGFGTVTKITTTFQKFRGPHWLRTTPDTGGYVKEETPHVF